MGHLCSLGECVVDRLHSLIIAVFKGSARVERAGDSTCDKRESDEGLEEMHFDGNGNRNLTRVKD